MAADPYFSGRVNFASELTNFRIYFGGKRFAFVRTGRCEPYRPSGVSGALTRGISAAVHAAAGDGPANKNAGQLAAMGRQRVDDLLKEHPRNFLLMAAEITAVEVRPPLCARLSSQCNQGIWRFSSPQKGTLKVRLSPLDFDVAMPALIAAFGEGILGNWQWDKSLKVILKK